MPVSATSGTSRSGLLLAMFFVTIILPISMDVAGMNLSPIKVYLLIMLVPFASNLVSGRAGGMVKTDAFMFGFVLWIIVTLVFHHGIERFPYSVILAVEAFGGYLAGRILVRNVADYRRFINYYLILLLALLPLAVYELNYGRMPLADIFKGIFQVQSKNIEFRYDMSRVQVAFPHSILYGLFCSLTIGSICYLYGNSLVRTVPRLCLAIGMTLMSLSSGPMISIVVQLLIVGWGKLTGERWKLLIILVTIAYVFLETFSNRGAVIIFIESFTLNPQSAWWRVYIWKYGTASVMAHPLMGIGLNEWERPFWLASTVDNFWLLMAMRHGFPGIVFLALAVGMHIFFIQRQRNLGPDAALARKAYMVTLVSLIFTLFTVHIWGAMNVMAMFFIGAGVFFYTTDPNPQDAVSAEPDQVPQSARRGLPLSRFPQIASPTQPSGLQRKRAVGRAGSSLSGRAQR